MCILEAVGNVEASEYADQNALPGTQRVQRSLVLNTPSPEAVHVTAIHVTVVRPRASIKFQLWRPGGAPCTYTLVDDWLSPALDTLGVQVVRTLLLIAVSFVQYPKHV